VFASQQTPQAAVKACIVCGGPNALPLAIKPRGGRRYCQTCKLKAAMNGLSICVHPLHEGSRMELSESFYHRKGKALSYCKKCHVVPVPKPTEVVS